MARERATTPPSIQALSTPLTPEQVKRVEINRLKAKALRDQQEAADFRQSANVAAGQKRPRAAISSGKTPLSQRDGRSIEGPKSGLSRPLDEIEPARNFTRYVEYDFSKMTDTKGGFLTTEDDPHNKVLSAKDGDEKPAHMTLKEWERLQLLKSLREQKAGPFEPGASVMKDKDVRICRECESADVDRSWEEIFGCAVCNACKERLPEKYSLLTKTEAKEDYLLTDPELKDPELLPHLERPNPHKATWNNMMLFLRYQVEEYAFNTKWGSAEALDAAFEKREADKKRRKQEKFKSKLLELKKRTRVDAHRRNRAGNGGSSFGDSVGRDGKHTHEWGQAIEDPETGASIKKCVECGMEAEELEF